MGGVRNGRIARKGMQAAVAVLVAAALSGCVGGSRSGTDQPGVPDAGRNATQPAQKESINKSSEDDVAAALRRGDVDDPQGWARILVGDRPYPPGQPGQDRIRQVLVDHGGDPDEVDKALAVVEP
ncbi:hypothetical protein [Pseudonocardia adelaidensis]|uniref:Uncharacterized protein n=1 Tax=Pseudonocardia adelaidensis TaxID=648754 RepID=A0ABP9N6P9_9PSEU